MLDSDEQSPSEIQKDQLLQHNMMIHIEGDEASMFNEDDEDNDERQDQVRDHQMRLFLDDLKAIGPQAKNILNYTYPPLLYQRGGDSQDDDDEDEDGEEDGLP